MILFFFNGILQVNLMKFSIINSSISRVNDVEPKKNESITICQHMSTIKYY